MHEQVQQLPQKTLTSATSQNVVQNSRESVNEKPILSPSQSESKVDIETEDPVYTDIEWTDSLSISQCTIRLSQILEELLRGKPDDSVKEFYEQALKSVTQAIPQPLKAFTQYYPRNYLSEILMVNYADLVKFCSLYLNLSLSSQVTKFVVNLFYSLECWEIYHLLHMIPNLDYFLLLIDIEVTETPFGHIVSPPENYMGFNLRQGFQYPFPFPFYNFSYHTMNPDVIDQKYQRLRIDNYIDIRLNKMQAKKKQKVRPPKSNEIVTTFIQESPSGRHKPITSTVVLKRKQFTFHEMTAKEIDKEGKELAENDDDEGYNTDEAEKMTREEIEAVQKELLSKSEQRFVPSMHSRLMQKSSAGKHLNKAMVVSPSTKYHTLRNVLPGQPPHTFTLGGIPPTTQLPGKFGPSLPSQTQEPVSTSTGSDAQRQSPAMRPQPKRPVPEHTPQGSNPDDATKILPQPPSFISKAPVPASVQYPPQYDPARLPYFDPSMRQVGAHYSLPQFQTFASLPPPSIVSPPQNEDGQEGSPQIQQFSFQGGYPPPPPYGLPMYGPDGRMYVQMPFPQTLNPQLGPRPQGIQGQHSHSPQFQHQHHFQPMGLQFMSPHGYQQRSQQQQQHASPLSRSSQQELTQSPQGIHRKVPQGQEEEPNLGV